MNVTNIMIDLLRLEKKGKLHDYFIKYGADHVYLSEGHWICKIPHDDFLFDVNKLIGKGIKTYESIERLLQPKEVQDAKETGNIKRMGITNGVEFACGNEFIYVDEKFLKNYDKYATFKGTNGKAPLYVFENNDIIGAILPIAIK